MALWQFDLFFVPAQAGLPTLEDAGWALPMVSERLVVEARSLLSSRIGAPWIMCEDISVFGIDTGNSIQFIPGLDGEAELLARIDARAESVSFCRLLSELASRIGCQFFSPELRVSIEPKSDTLVDVLMRSRSWRYALDSAATLRELADSGPDDAPQS